MNKALRIAIINRGLKQYELAKRIGVDEARMSGFVHARLEPTSKQKRQLSRILKAPVAELFPSPETVSA